MEVASLRSEDDPAPGGVTKRILQGRPLPAILVDNHQGSRYPSFRPHQRRPSLQKGVSGGREGASTPCDSGVSFSSPEGDPPHHASTTSKSSVRSNPRGGGPGAGLGTSPKKRKRRARPAAPLPPGLLSSTSSGVSSGRASEPPHSKSQHRVGSVWTDTVDRHSVGSVWTDAVDRQTDSQTDRQTEGRFCVD